MGSPYPLLMASGFYQNTNNNYHHMWNWQQMCQLMLIGIATSPQLSVYMTVIFYYWLLNTPKHCDECRQNMLMGISKLCAVILLENRNYADSRVSVYALGKKESLCSASMKVAQHLSMLFIYQSSHLTLTYSWKSIDHISTFKINTSNAASWMTEPFC